MESEAVSDVECLCHLPMSTYGEITSPELEEQSRPRKYIRQASEGLGCPRKTNDVLRLYRLIIHHCPNQCENRFRGCRGYRSHCHDSVFQVSTSMCSLTCVRSAESEQCMT